jgi:hypothetical protein
MGRYHRPTEALCFAWAIAVVRFDRFDRSTRIEGLREGCEFRYASDAVVNPMTFWSKILVENASHKRRSYVLVVLGAYVLTLAFGTLPAPARTDLE